MLFFTPIKTKDEFGMNIKVENLSYGYLKNKKVLNGINFSLEEGDIFSLIGTNGSGKSTLLKCIAQIIPYTKGRIQYYGKESRDYSRKELAKIVAYLSQNQLQMLNYNVEEFLLTGRAPYIGSFSRPENKDYEIVHEVANKLGLEEILFRNINSLSGGQRQKIMFARALVQESKIILLDEPMNHLDFKNQLEILKLIKDLSNTGKTIVMVNHDPNTVLSLGGKVGILNQYGEMLMGDSDQLIHEKNLQNLYKAPLYLVHVPELNRKVFAMRKI